MSSMGSLEERHLVPQEITRTLMLRRKPLPPMPMHLLTLLFRQQPRMPTVLLMLLLKLLRQQRKLLLLLACLREVERNTCIGLGTLWLLHLILLASTCRWMSRLQEGRGPLSSRLPRPTRQKRRTSKTRLLVQKQQRRGLPLHLTMRNGLYSLTRNPRLRSFRFRSRCWTRRWPQCTPPCQLRRAQVPPQPQGTRPPLLLKLLRQQRKLLPLLACL